MRTNKGADEIIVTGTRINRPNTFSAAPITSVIVQDIQAQAPLNVEEVLNRLPQIAPTPSRTIRIPPVSDVTFRGSYNKAQRAPTVIEIRQATTVNYGTQGGAQGNFCAPT